MAQLKIDTLQTLQFFDARELSRKIEHTMLMQLKAEAGLPGLAYLDHITAILANPQHPRHKKVSDAINQSKDKYPWVEEIIMFKVIIQDIKAPANSFAHRDRRKDFQVAFASVLNAVKSLDPQFTPTKDVFAEWLTANEKVIERVVLPKQ